VQTFSFVHTTGDSKWRFGFCRQDPRTNTAMVLISYLPWHDTFLKLLPILGELKRTDPNGFRAFLSEAYNQGVPDCGGSLKVFYNAGQGVSKESFITCKQAFNPCFAFLSKSSLPSSDHFSSSCPACQRM